MSGGIGEFGIGIGAIGIETPPVVSPPPPATFTGTPALDDIGHVWGQDLQVGPTGDLARVNEATRTQQRILRRVLTALGSYLFEPTYGAGLPQKIGQALNIGEVKGIIRGQMLLEPSVASIQSIEVVPIQGGVSVKVRYTSLPDKQPVVLTFSYAPPI